MVDLRVPLVQLSWECLRGMPTKRRGEHCEPAYVTLALKINNNKLRSVKNYGRQT